jgi:hypothetical protein
VTRPGFTHVLSYNPRNAPHEPGETHAGRFAGMPRHYWGMRRDLSRIDSRDLQVKRCVASAPSCRYPDDTTVAHGNYVGEDHRAFFSMPIPATAGSMVSKRWSQLGNGSCGLTGIRTPPDVSCEKSSATGQAPEQWPGPTGLADAREHPLPDGAGKVSDVRLCLRAGNGAPEFS